MKIKAIIFGATGMVGEGVLHECLSHPVVEKLLVINRRPCGVGHEKLAEIIHRDFFDLESIEDQLSGFNACFFCMGVSSVRKKEEEYRRITYDLTIYIAQILANKNPQMTFCYVSGAGTDSSESGRIMWARLKGKTENHLLNLPFKAAYMFRPGYIQPTQGLNNAYNIYKLFMPFYPLWRMLAPKYVGTLNELGLAMIHAVSNGSVKKVLDSQDIRVLADKG